MKLTGIQIGANPWSVGGEYTLPAVLRALPIIAPPGAVLYLEATSVLDTVAEVLSTTPAANVSDVYPGTIAPKPRRFHVPATVAVLDALADRADNVNENEVCDHMVLYVGATVLLSGYDFGSLPLLLDRMIPKETIQEFAKRAGGTVEPAA